MVQDNSKNSDDPHKIYEIINSDRECDIPSIPLALYKVWFETQKGICSFFFAQTIMKICESRTPLKRIRTWLRRSTVLQSSASPSETRYSVHPAPTFTSLHLEFLCDSLWTLTFGHINLCLFSPPSSKTCFVISRLWIWEIIQVQESWGNTVSLTRSSTAFYV